MMSDTGSGRDSVEQLLESFLARWRRGERPSLEEYAARCPERADEIRELFPAVVEMEQLKPPVAVDAGPPEQPSIKPESAARPEPTHPERLGDYRIIRIIGEGGMGVVYEAERESLSNRVALKVMHPRFRADASHLRRFRQEARSAARLHHTNIVPVFDFGEQDGICYYAMQYIAGHSLNDVLEEVRQLRRENQKLIAATDTVAQPEDGEGSPADRANFGETGRLAPDPLRRTVTLGLLTGRYTGAPSAEEAEAGSSSVIQPLSLLAVGMGREEDLIAIAAAKLAVGIETTIDGEKGQTGPLPREVNIEQGAAGGESTAPPGEPPSAPRPIAAGESSSSATGSSLAGRTDDSYHREIARLGAQVADALDYAHRQGVVHRDIKPSNLLLDAQGNLWITDFGLAKLVEGDDLSQSRDVVGTLRFMAPERFRGVTDPASDIYAVGATLYEMLALCPAFNARDQILLIDQIAHQAPAPLRQHDRRIPRDLETIVLKTLSKDPKDRCDKAGELRDELRRYLEGRPTRWRRVGVVEQFRRWCKRNPLLAAASIAAAVLTVFLAISSTIAAWTFRDQRNRLEIEQGNTRANLKRALVAERSASERLGETQKAERQARLELGKSLQAEGAALQRSGLEGQRFKSLERLAEAAHELREHPEGRDRLPELRDQAITAMGLTDLRMLWQRDIGLVRGVPCDRKLERYAFVELPTKPGVGGQIVVRSMDNDRELFRIPRPEEGSPGWVGFNPDGQYLFAARGDEFLDIWDLERQERVFHQRVRRDERAFLPDGRRLVFCPPGKDLVVWDLVDRKEVKRLALEFSPWQLCVDSDGRRIAANAREPQPREVRIIDVETGRALARWTENVGNEGMSWSSDGRLLAVGDADDRLFIWDVERGRLASVSQGHTGEVRGCLFAPATHLLATWSWGDTTRFWNAATGEFLASARQGQPVGFSHDGRRLAFYDSSHLGVWEVSHGEDVLTLSPCLVGNLPEAGGRGQIDMATYSPDGRLVAVSTEEAVYLYDGHADRELAQLNAGKCDGVVFDRHGRSLITYGVRGLFQWPIRDDPAAGSDAFTIGPPMLVRETTSDSWFKVCWLPDGRTLAMLEKESSRVLLVDTQGPYPARARTASLSSPSSSRPISIAVSPDGRWAAAGSWIDRGIYVWDLPKRRLERILPGTESDRECTCLAAFSPDSRWLVSCSGAGPASGYYFWKVGTWERGPFVPTSQSAGWVEPLFSPDARVIALCVSPEQVRLAEASTGRTIAHLSTLQPLAATPLAFSPDGARLIAKTNQKTALVWDLRRIRERLRTMDLDWDEPPLPPETSSPGAALPPIRSVRVLGEALEPGARRTAELAAVEAKLHNHPDDPDALFERGWLKLRMWKQADAIADLERGLRLRPDDPDALFLLVEAHSQTNNLQAGRATLERYLAHAEDDIDARVMKGQMALQLGRLREAADDFTKVLDADPGRDRVRLRRARICLRLGRFREALADLDALIERRPKDFALYELRSEVHERLGHHEQAQADMKKASESPKPDAMSYNNRAWILANGPVESRDPEEALALAQKAVALAPGTAIILNTLGVAQYRVGRYAEAVASLEKSLAASNGESDAFDLFFLAMARCKLGQVAQARADFERAIRWRRSHPKPGGEGWAEELDAFQAESEALLDRAGLALPADVFGPPR
jgi:serine/threonine protein kinase/WD40 repeat protein/Tfp pilus assembly protein PilF